MVIERVTERDYTFITSEKFSFDWELEKEYAVYKLTPLNATDILGLISLQFFDMEERVEVRLIAAAKEHVGSTKCYDRIIGNLFAFSARIASAKYKTNAIISLIPKTLLIEHYMEKYGFQVMGKRLFLDERSIIILLKEYDHEPKK